MINTNNVSVSKDYSKPWSELLEAAPEAILCISGEGTIEPVDYEEWGPF